MNSTLANWLVSFVIKQEFFEDYRSYIAGSASIFTGLSILAYCVAQGVWTKETTGPGIIAVIAGYKMIGDAGKKDKALALEREKVLVEKQKLAVTVASATKEGAI